MPRAAKRPDKLTEAEKDVIRASPCSQCGEAPPFGRHKVRCSCHRLVPKKGYVKGNVVPRCPYCHGDEHPAKREWILALALGGALKGARRGGRSFASVLATDAVRQFLNTSMLRKAGRASWAGLSKRERSREMKRRWQVGRANKFRRSQLKNT